MRLSVIIPTFNQEAVLARHLSQTAAAAAALGGGAEVLVVDDAGDHDGRAIEAVIGSVGPPVRLLRQRQHRGFAATCNAGAGACQGDLLLFLNSDIHCEPGSIEALAAVVESNPNLFAAAPVLFNLRERFYESTLRLRFHRGVFDVLQPGRSGAAPPPAGELRPVAYACGGAFACRRRRFLDLGGFSTLLSPFYWEDADLGWRARCRGWASAECGSARMLHDHGQTIQAFHKKRSILTIYERNRLLFTWLHLQGGACWRTHLVWLPLRWVAALVRGRPDSLALPLALRRMAAVARERRRLRTCSAQAQGLIQQIRESGSAGWPQPTV